MPDREKGSSAEDILILETLEALKRKEAIDLEHSLAQINQLFPEVVGDAQRLRELRVMAGSRGWGTLPPRERKEADAISLKYLLDGNLSGLSKPKGKLFARTSNLIQQVQSAKMSFG